MISKKNKRPRYIVIEVGTSRVAIMGENGLILLDWELDRHPHLFFSRQTAIDAVLNRRDHKKLMVIETRERLR